MNSTKPPSTRKATGLVAVWIPTETIARLDVAVRMLDLDRSKVIRRALREHLARLQSPAPTV